MRKDLHGLRAKVRVPWELLRSSSVDKAREEINITGVTDRVLTRCSYIYFFLIVIV